MSTSLTVKALAAMDENRGIGRDGGLPWRIPEDMRRVAALTTGHTVLMGRKTYESIPAKYRPLPDRVNVVATHDKGFALRHPQVQVCASPREYILRCREGEIEVPSGILWVFGGAQVYNETLALCDEIELTQVRGAHGCDAFFPEFEEFFTLVESIEREGYSFLRYRRTRQQ